MGSPQQPFMVPNPLAQTNQEMIKSLTQSVQQSATTGGSFPSQEEEGGVHPNMLSALRSINAMHAANEEVGKLELNRFQGMEAAGFPVSGKLWQKALKKSGYKADTSPEGIHQILSQVKEFQSQKDPLTGEQQQLPQEIQDFASKAAIPTGQPGALTKKDLVKFVTGAAILQEKRTGRMAGANEREQAMHAQQANQAIDTAMDENKDPLERGKAFAQARMLMPQTYGKMTTPEELSITNPAARQFFMGQAMQEETKAQKDARHDDLVTQGLNMGLSDQDSQKRAEQIVAGQPVTVGAGRMTPQQVTAYTGALQVAIERGVPPNLLDEFARVGAQQGIDKALKLVPAGTIPIAQAELKLRERQVTSQERAAGYEGKRLDIEQQRMDMEQQRLNLADAREQRLNEYMTKTLGYKDPEGVKNLTEVMKTMAEAEKIGQFKYPDSIKQQVVSSLAMAMGMHKEQVPKLWGFMSKEDWVSDTPTVPPQGDTPSKVPGQAGQPAPAKEQPMLNPPPPLPGWMDPSNLPGMLKGIGEAAASRVMKEAFPHSLADDKARNKEQ